MSNEQIVNPYEGQLIPERIVWPFYRYKVLMPEQIGGDLFVWLYLSLFVYQNESKKKDKESYEETEKNEVKRLISDKFAAVIDAQTLEKIISNAEDDFVDKTGKIKSEAFTFIETYENLFSDKLEVRFVYQDAVSGEVLPYFGDSSFLEDGDIHSIDYAQPNVIECRKGVTEPSKVAIKSAFKQYLKLKKFNEEISPFLSDEVQDDDEQTFLDDDSEEFVEKKEIKHIEKYDVIFLQKSKVIFNLYVSLSVRDNRLLAKSPFDNNTDQWMNKCLLKGRNVSQKLGDYYTQLAGQYTLDNRKISTYIESYKGDFASSMKYCQTIYRMIDTMNDNKMREIVLKMEQSFETKDVVFYLYIGQLFDKMVKTITYTSKSTFEQRRNTPFEMYCREIDQKFLYKNIKYEFLKSKNIYDNWVKGGNGYVSFKADVADILLRTDIIDSKIMYPDFVDDLFALYGKRNAFTHADEDEKLDINQGVIQKAEKVIKVLFELI